jgi:hypothetical protein
MNPCVKVTTKQSILKITRMKNDGRGEFNHSIL